MQFDLALLSKYRTQLMGFAMIWVMFDHSRITFSNEAFEFIRGIGYGGVDIFLMLSGLGVFFSLSKENDIKKFYKKRVLRILPYYLPIVLIYSIYLCNFYNISISLIFYNLTTLSFWLNVTNTLGVYGFDWYIPSLMVFYLISPFYMRFFNKKPIYSTILITILAITISLLIANTRWSYLLIFTIRIPIFFIGILIGYLITQNKKINLAGIITLLLLFVIGITSLYYILTECPNEINWQYGLWWIPFILITFPLIMALSSLFSFIKCYNFLVLTFVGKYSLVIYLLHERILNILFNTNITDSMLILNAITLITVIVVGYIYQNQIERIIDKILKK